MIADRALGRILTRPVPFAFWERHGVRPTRGIPGASLAAWHVEVAPDTFPIKGSEIFAFIAIFLAHLLISLFAGQV